VFKHPVIFIVLLLSVSISWAGPASEGQGKDPGHAAEGTLESENRRLQAEVERLEDANNMLMENLANCAEENGQLSEKLDASAPSKQIAPRQAELIESIRRALSVPSGLEFLSRLNEEQLHALLMAIRSRVK
jgi:hypothetical protein